MSNGSFWLIGTGGSGAKVSVNISTFMPKSGPTSTYTAQILATDTGNFSSTVQLLSVPDSGGPSSNLQVRQTWNTNGTIAFPTMPNLPSSGSADLTIDPSGNVAPQTSSLRFKEDVQPLREDFQKILALEPKSFKYKDTGFRGIGYAAEELAALGLNDLVSYDAEGEPLSINYKLLPIYLLEVLKEQRKVISELQTEVAAVKAPHGN